MDSLLMASIGLAAFAGGLVLGVVGGVWITRPVIAGGRT